MNCKPIPYTALDHSPPNPQFLDACDPNYVDSDLDGTCPLTVTIFGYEIGEAEAHMIKKFLNNFTEDCLDASIRRRK